MTAPTTIAVLPTSPRSAVRATLNRSAGCSGASASTSWCGVGEVLVAPGDTSSIGDSLVESLKRFAAAAEIFMQLQ